MTTKRVGMGLTILNVWFPIIAVGIGAYLLWASKNQQPVQESPQDVPNRFTVQQIISTWEERRKKPEYGQFLTTGTKANVGKNNAPVLARLTAQWSGRSHERAQARNYILKLQKPGKAGHVEWDRALQKLHVLQGYGHTLEQMFTSWKGGEVNEWDLRYGSHTIMTVNFHDGFIWTLYPDGYTIEFRGDDGIHRMMQKGDPLEALEVPLSELTALIDPTFVRNEKAFFCPATINGGLEFFFHRSKE